MATGRDFPEMIMSQESEESARKVGMIRISYDVNHLTMICIPSNLLYFS